jgi:hypothetical protein
MRHGVEVSITVNDTECSDNFERTRSTLYTAGSYTSNCDQTGKAKELINFTKNVTKECFHTLYCEDLGGGDFPEEIIETGFSTKLGIDWMLWMMLREIYSNMLDEGGEYFEDYLTESVPFGTIVKLKFEEGSDFAHIWDHRHLYINEQEPLFVISDKVEALRNDEGFLRIYKQNILVYEDLKTPSKFAYNIKFGEIDEKRILSNLYSVEGSIIYEIMGSKNEDYLREIITGDELFESNEFMRSSSTYRSASEDLHEFVCSVFEACGEVHSYPWLIDAIKERKDCGIGGKKIKNIGDSIWSYSGTVTVETPPKVFEKPDQIYSFSDEISDLYNFKLDVEVKTAKLKGSKVIADKFENCLIIDETFDINVDFPAFIVQYLDLTQGGNIIIKMSEYISKLLKK